MYYEINVSRGGVHYFATAERSLTTLTQVKEVYQKLKISFPENAGYSITISKWQKVGESIDPEKI
jgi:hypothetical protein